MGMVTSNLSSILPFGKRRAVAAYAIRSTFVKYLVANATNCPSDG
jgi:hypothetical protein